MKSTTKKCIVCGIEIIPTKWKDRNRIEYQKFCSESCRGKYNFQRHHNYYKKYWLSRPHLFEWVMDKNCEVCGKKFTQIHPSQIQCSVTCTKRKWKLSHRESVNKAQRAWFKRKRKEDPERFRWYVKQRKHLLRSTSNSTKSFSTSFTRQDWEDIKQKFGNQCAICSSIGKRTRCNFCPTHDTLTS